MHKGCFSFCFFFFKQYLSFLLKCVQSQMCINKFGKSSLAPQTCVSLCLSFPSPQGSHLAVPGFPQGCFWGSFWSLSSSLLQNLPLPSAPQHLFRQNLSRHPGNRIKSFSVATRMKGFISLQQSSVGPLLPVFSSIVRNVTHSKWGKFKNQVQLMQSTQLILVSTLRLLRV